MDKSNSYSCQKRRIERVVDEFLPGKVAEFDEASGFIRFRVIDPLSNTPLTGICGMWFVSEIADKTDDWLRTLIRNSSGGKI